MRLWFGFVVVAMVVAGCGIENGQTVTVQYDDGASQTVLLGSDIGDWSYEEEELIDGIEHRYTARTDGFISTDTLTILCSSTGEVGLQVHSASLSLGLMFEEYADFRFRYDSTEIETVRLPFDNGVFDASYLPLRPGHSVLFMATEVDGEPYEMKFEIAGLSDVMVAFLATHCMEGAEIEGVEGVEVDQDSG